MASKTITTTEYIDDLDGSKADGTLTFSFDGASYEIDLSKKNATAFTKALKPYVENARKVRGARVRVVKSSAGRSKTRTDLPEIRAWAQSNGYEVSGRGRIPAAVIEAFDAK